MSFSGAAIITSSRAMASNERKYLPLIYNPLLNSIFNNPIHAKSAVRSTILELARAHNDYAILVPPGQILQECQDDSSEKLIDLCNHNDDFVKSHIIKISAAFSATTAPVTKVQLIIYNTMNGRQVLIKNRMVFTGKGFKKSMKLSIVDVGYFISFCDYFPNGSRFLVLYIEDTLYGHKTSLSLPPVVEGQLAKLPQKLSETDVTFERILRTFPVLSQAMSEHFYILFHHNNRQFQRLRTRHKMPLTNVIEEFTAIVNEAFTIVQNCVNANSTDGDRAFNLVQAIIKEYPLLDLNRLIHEYVELNIYDNVWLQLVFQYQNYQPDDEVASGEAPRLVLTPSLYKDLSCLSLNQLEIPVEEPWSVNVLCKRVSDAIEMFSKLSDLNISNQRLKVKIMTDTINILTDGSEFEDDESKDGITIDADTLIGLLIMVVVHSKVPNLEAHLFYIRYFGLNSMLLKEATPDGYNNAGFLNYILSNIDAVIYLLSGSGDQNLHLEEMTHLSSQNYEFWYAIQKEHVSRVNELLDQVRLEYGERPLPKNHYLRSRNIHGESCFTFAIRTRNSEMFHALLLRTEQWILFEDLVFDRNTSTNQNLLMLALQEEAHEIVMEIIDTFTECATIEEQILYYNLKDVNGRTVGHYLSHDIEALETIGHQIDWKIKDNNSHTPLFSICRCYDHPNYRTLIQKAFACISKGNTGPITFDDHIDKSGNTLLHVIAKGIPESGLLSENKSLVDVNKFNKKFLSPIGVFIKYSRLENLLCLFEDKRLIFNLEDPKNFYNILDYYSFSASRSQNGKLDIISKIRQAVVSKYFSHNFPFKVDFEYGAMNARYDGNLKDWIVNVVYKDSGNPAITSVAKFLEKPSGKPAIATKYVPLNQIRQFIKIQKLASPLSFTVNSEAFWVNYPSGGSAIPFCSKFRTNRMLEHLTLLFLSINFHSKSSQKLFFQGFSQSCRDDPVLILDFMKAFSHKQELEKSSIGEVKLSSLKIDEIDYFLNFTITDLLRYQSQVAKLKKLVSIGGVKQSDVRAVYDKFLSRLPEVSESELEFDKEVRDVDASYHKFQPYVLWIEMCVAELLKNCGAVIKKLNRWRQTYSKIKEINAEIHRFEGQIVTHGSGEADGDHRLNRSISRRSTLSLDAMPLEDDESASSTFFGLIDNKKSRYRKLLCFKAEEVKKVMDLNVEIKLDHEAIAAEISSFLAFRSGFMKFAIKQFTNASLVLLRHRQYELTKTLHETRHAHG